MKYCPICGAIYKDDTVCSCGWDPRTAYEECLTLGPVKTSTLNENALRRRYIQKLLKEAMQEPESRITALETQVKSYETKVQAMEKQLQTLISQVTPGKSWNDYASKHIPAARKPESKAVENTKSTASVKVGDKISLGRYPQGKNGERMDIQWRVLAIEAEKALLISDKGLDAQPYNTKAVEVTWENCTLRQWLNSYFFTAAFSLMEKSQIRSSTVTADANSKYKTNPGKDTKDVVFLLSIKEAEKYFHNDSERRCFPTDYAISQGAYTSVVGSDTSKATCRWRLRTPGGHGDTAALVYFRGSIDYIGSFVPNADMCVRPALWIDLKFCESHKI